MQDKLTEKLNQQYREYAAAPNPNTENALASVMLPYATRAVSSIMRELAKDEAQDVATDCVMAALTQMRSGGYRGDSTFSTWFFGIIKRHSFDAMREKIFAKTHLESYEPENFDRPDSSDAEKKAMVKEALATLDAEERALIEMKVLQGMSAEEIQAALGLNVPQINYRYRRVKEKLAARLGGKSSRPKTPSLPKEDAVNA